MYELRNVHVAVRGYRTSKQILNEDEWHVGLGTLLHEGVAVTRVEWDDHQLDDLSCQRLRHYTTYTSTSILDDVGTWKYSTVCEQVTS